MIQELNYIYTGQCRTCGNYAEKQPKVCPFYKLVQGCILTIAYHCSLVSTAFFSFLQPYTARPGNKATSLIPRHLICNECQTVLQQKSFLFVFSGLFCGITLPKKPLNLQKREIFQR